MNKSVWYERNFFVKDFIPNNISLIDFGCGQKEILDFVTPSEYLGIDIHEDADIQHDLNKPLLLDKKYDLGLWLGVLEYLDDPKGSLINQVNCAQRFLILTLNVEKKTHHGWKHAFTYKSIDRLLTTIFISVEHHFYNKYTLSICR
jgi:hypothetical protein